MTIRRADDGVLLEDVCAVEDAEALMHQLQAGANFIDWSACTHLHAACLQVLLVSGMKLNGTPANPALAHWIAPLFATGLSNTLATGAAQTAHAPQHDTQNEA